jgi:TolB-like protein/tetratricopeptide (TPR) repeat protein
MASSIATPGTEREEIPPSSIRAELARILESRTFHGAEAQRKFLRYVVESVVDHTSAHIKEVAIGIDVFDRGNQFDPRIDTIVRVEARKLRTRLNRYYETEGAGDSIRILFPARGYTPSFQYSGEIRETAESEPEGDQSPLSNVVPPAENVLSVGDSSDPLRAEKLHTSNRHALLLALSIAAILVCGVVGFRLTSRGTRAGTPSIAVLPFRNLGDAQEDASISDGLTDELIDSLGRVQGLRVIARTSSFQFGDGHSDLREIGQKLSVRMVLEGSVGKYGDRLRINAQLDDVTNGLRVWSSSYDRDARDILKVQKDISEAIVQALRSQFAEGGKLSSPPDKRARPVDPEAYRDYLRGVFFWNKNTAGGLKAAISYFQKAVTEDPGYARAWAGLARCYVGFPSFSLLPSRDAEHKIRDAAFRSLALDPEQGEAHIYLGYAAMLAYDWRTAEREFRTGLQREPGNAVGHRWFANYLLTTGEATKALAENQTAEDLDPVSPYMITGTSRTLNYLGRDDEAIAHAKKALLLDPNFGVAHQSLGRSYLRKRMFDQAIQEFRQAQQETDNDATSTAWLGYAFALTGKSVEAQELRAQLKGRGALASRSLALIDIGLGDKDSAFSALDVSIRSQRAVVMLKSDPVYTPLRSDQRYSELIKMMGL